MITNFGRLGKLVVLLAFRRSKRERGRLPALPSAVRVERDRQGAKKERKDNLKKKESFWSNLMFKIFWVQYVRCIERPRQFFFIGTWTIFFDNLCFEIFIKLFFYFTFMVVE